MREVQVFRLDGVDARQQAPFDGDTAITIGNFDGVHLGHQHVVKELAQLAHGKGLCPAVLTFDPHPAAVVGGGAPPLLSTVQDKARWLGEAGARDVFVQRFDSVFAALSPEAFVDQLLAPLGARAIMVGDNFHFGAGRAGDVLQLAALGKERGFSVHVHSLAADREGAFSSTRARLALEAGDVQAAARVLGRPHVLSGLVIEGEQLGRKLGFPTANLGDIPQMLPRGGVYAVTVSGVGEGVLNIGYRPTVSGERRLSTEVHILDYSGDLYGKTLRLQLQSRLRDEQRFSSVDELVAQIGRDVVAARTRFFG
jgi:riboflavin kinase/FMN adenylyltransferase